MTDAHILFDRQNPHPTFALAFAAQAPRRDSGLFAHLAPLITPQVAPSGNGNLLHLASIRTHPHPQPIKLLYYAFDLKTAALLPLPFPALLALRHNGIFTLRQLCDHTLNQVRHMSRLNNETPPLSPDELEVLVRYLDSLGLALRTTSYPENFPNAPELADAAHQLLNFERVYDFEIITFCDFAEKEGIIEGRDLTRYLTAARALRITFATPPADSLETFSCAGSLGRRHFSPEVILTLRRNKIRTLSDLQQLTELEVRALLTLSPTELCQLTEHARQNALGNMIIAERISIRTPFQYRVPEADEVSDWCVDRQNPITGRTSRALSGGVITGLLQSGYKLKAELASLLPHELALIPGVGFGRNLKLVQSALESEGLSLRTPTDHETATLLEDLITAAVKTRLASSTSSSPINPYDVAEFTRLTYANTAKADTFANTLREQNITNLKNIDATALALYIARYLLTTPQYQELTQATIFTTDGEALIKPTDFSGSPQQKALYEAFFTETRAPRETFTLLSRYEEDATRDASVILGKMYSLGMTDTSSIAAESQDHLLNLGADLTAGLRNDYTPQPSWTGFTPQEIKLISEALQAKGLALSTRYRSTVLPEHLDLLNELAPSAHPVLQIVPGDTDDTKPLTHVFTTARSGSPLHILPPEIKAAYYGTGKTTGLHELTLMLQMLPNHTKLAITTDPSEAAIDGQIRIYRETAEEETDPKLKTKLEALYNHAVTERSNVLAALTSINSSGSITLEQAKLLSLFFYYDREQKVVLTDLDTSLSATAEVEKGKFTGDFDMQTLRNTRDVEAAYVPGLNNVIWFSTKVRPEDSKGPIRVYIAGAGGKWSSASSMARLIETDADRGIFSITFDPAAHGIAGRNYQFGQEFAYDMDSYMAWLHQIVTQLNTYGKRVVLVGRSTGANTARQYAHTYPGSALAVVAMGGYTPEVLDGNMQKLAIKVADGETNLNPVGLLEMALLEDNHPWSTGFNFYNRPFSPDDLGGTILGVVGAEKDDEYPDGFIHELAEEASRNGQSSLAFEGAVQHNPYRQELMPPMTPERMAEGLAMLDALQPFGAEEADLLTFAAALFQNAVAQVAAHEINRFIHDAASGENYTPTQQSLNAYAIVSDNKRRALLKRLSVAESTLTKLEKNQKTPVDKLEKAQAELELQQRTLANFDAEYQTNLRLIAGWSAYVDRRAEENDVAFGRSH
ncbi:MAG: hypothetical protein COX62_02725 [Deltaproteobacteria bacterium CG_4_10_14_0_2_um_filter_43_8]|nr:MAG: hypothetical protein COV43_02095 [Deltaproteobacteria bacterium CG11_big_fil_rev_8_21_14_0_20_42_23]PJA21328.1 MAG: hypothetical protein COX62_02725 [Deltaproteobacteria bacterium CG_4_10_14_0_2_um_filter_43_8]PJC64721.1 MAG: hypothetical protein CO021_02630 [Deltaproteobacteria bacterium CG_4_9_14_0_2_um_filter_42_21]